MRALPALPTTLLMTVLIGGCKADTSPLHGPDSRTTEPPAPAFSSHSGGTVVTVHSVVPEGTDPADREAAMTFTGVHVQEGDLIHVTATGLVKGGPDFLGFDFYDADGAPAGESQTSAGPHSGGDFPIILNPPANIYSLIGSIRDPVTGVPNAWLFFGTDNTVAANASGELVLLVHDALYRFDYPAAYRDNVGGFEATIEVLAECELNVSRLSQGDPMWAGDTYDNTDSTIRARGCALTALSMALNFAGVANDPGSLNQFMIDNGDYSGSTVWWGPTVRDRAGPPIKFNTVNATNVEELGKLICTTGYPVVVGVNGSTHFVLATGYKDGEILVADPGYVNRTTLSVYNNQFSPRGYVADPPADISELDLAVTNAYVVLTDSHGRRAGYDPATGQGYTEIPGSAYFLDAIADDVTGAPPDGFTFLLQVAQPEEGMYTAVVLGSELTSYVLSIRGFSKDGSKQPPIEFDGVSNSGTESKFALAFEKEPGDRTQAVRIASTESTIADIDAAEELGLIDNRGIARSLRKKIEKAMEAAERGNIKSAVSGLNAFRGEVEAQASKHVDEVVAGILLQDAASLIEQLASE